MQQNKKNKKIILVDGITRRVSRISNTEYRAASQRVVLYSGLKMFGVSLLAIVLLVSLSSVGSTVSYMNDVEASIGNYLRADPLGFNVEIDGSSSVQVDLSSGDVSLTPVMTPNTDSELIQYVVSANITGGDSEFCSEIRMKGDLPFVYDGDLASMKVGTTTQTGAWTTKFSLLDAGTFSNTSCTVDIVYYGWNADVPFGRGYNDTQKVTITFYVPKPVEITAEPETVQGEASSTPTVDTPTDTIVDQTTPVSEPIVEPEASTSTPVVETPPTEEVITPTPEPDPAPAETATDTPVETPAS